MEGFIVGLTEDQAKGKTQIVSSQTDALFMMWQHLPAHPVHPSSQVLSDQNAHIIASVSPEMLSIGRLRRRMGLPCFSSSWSQTYPFSTHTLLYFFFLIYF